MSQDLVKALGITPAEKKASELAEQYSITKADTILDELAIEQHFKAGFLAALELAEVRGLVNALPTIPDDCGEHTHTGFMLDHKDCDSIRQALTAWRSFRGEK